MGSGEWGVGSGEWGVGGGGQLQPQGQKNFHYTEVLGDPHTVQACYPHFSHPCLGHLVPSPGLLVFFFFSSIRFL